MSTLASPSPAPRPRLLVMEFWGLGDLSFATPFLHAALERYEVTLVAKPHARPLLAPTFPRLRFVEFDAPWSAYRGKYRFQRWHWGELGRLVRELRWQQFAAAVSVRNDPRDHLLMALLGIPQRVGFPRRGSQVLLTEPVTRRAAKQHKVEDWWELARGLQLPGVEGQGPRLHHAAYASARVEEIFAQLRTDGRAVLGLHAGARIAVRRWPTAYFAEVVRALRSRFDFQLVLLPDPDGYGQELAPLADAVLTDLSVSELVDAVGRLDLLLCNDSGPGHLAAACGRPAVPVFGPTDPDWFRPWGEHHHLVIRDICPWRPCFDYCKFREPYCLTKLMPHAATPEVVQHVERLLQLGVLPATLRREEAPVAV